MLFLLQQKRVWRKSVWGWGQEFCRGVAFEIPLDLQSAREVQLKEVSLWLLKMSDVEAFPKGLAQQTGRHGCHTDRGLVRCRGDSLELARRDASGHKRMGSPELGAGSLLRWREAQCGVPGRMGPALIALIAFSEVRGRSTS